MAAIWTKFEIEMEKYVAKGTARTHNDFAKKFAKEYSQAIIPIEPKYANGAVLQPVLNAKKKRGILEKHFTKMLDDIADAKRKAVPKDFRTGAIGILKYWTVGIGVLISPFPAPFNALAPLVVGYAAKQEDWDDAIKDADLDTLAKRIGQPLGLKAIKSSVAGDPIIIVPSPLVLFPGILTTLELALYKAFVKSQDHHKFAKNLGKACKDHLLTVSGIYIGFRIPNTQGWPIPIVIIPFNGIS